MTRSRPPAFAAVAAALAAFAVHQARYGLAPESGAESHHGYLTYAPVVLALALAAALGVALARLAGAGEDSGARRSPLVVRWLGATALLVCVHGAQELAEGHAHEIVGGGAWLVLPLAAAAGLVLALGLDRTHAALGAGARGLRRLTGSAPRGFAVGVSWRLGAAPPLRRLSPAASAAPGRGPPPPVD